MISSDSPGFIIMISAFKAMLRGERSKYGHGEGLYMATLK